MPHEPFPITNRIDPAFTKEQIFKIRDYVSRKIGGILRADIIRSSETGEVVIVCSTFHGFNSYSLGEIFSESEKVNPFALSDKQIDDLRHG